MAIPENAQTIIDTKLKALLGQMLHLEVHQELGLPISGRTKVQFSYAPMITFRGFAPRFFLNGARDPLTVTTDYTLDTDTGTITLVSGSVFPGGLITSGNEITADYFFRYFTDDDLFEFLDMGLSELNLRKPATAYDWDTLHLEWNTVTALYALRRCLETILDDTTLWRPRIIFADPQETRDKLSGTLTSLNQQLDFLMKVAKRRGEAKPRAVVSARYATQQRVTNVNFWDFIIQV